MDIEQEEEDLLIVMHQSRPRFGQSLEADGAADLCEALGLARGLADLPVQIVHTGHPKLVVPHDGRTLLFRSRQGEAMGRPGEVEVRVDIEDDTPTRVRVAGHAVVVFEAELTLNR